MTLVLVLVATSRVDLKPRSWLQSVEGGVEQQPSRGLSRLGTWHGCLEHKALWLLEPGLLRNHPFSRVLGCWGSWIQTPIGFQVGLLGFGPQSPSSVHPHRCGLRLKAATFRPSSKPIKPGLSHWRCFLLKSWLAAMLGKLRILLAQQQIAHGIIEVVILMVAKRF